MENLIEKLPPTFIRELEEDLSIALERGFNQTHKRVSGKSLDSIRVESIHDTTIQMDLYAGGGIPYIISGKPAGTKMPVEKVGNKFQLVRELANWKKMTGFQGSDFILARSIAQKARAPVPMDQYAIKEFKKLSIPKLHKMLLQILSSTISTKNP